eukprot:601502-Pyramimonas_sp.AAC.1
MGIPSHKHDHAPGPHRKHGDNRKHHPPLVQLVAAQFDITDHPQTTVIPPSVVVHWGGRDADTSDALYILAPEQRNDAIVAHITRWQQTLEGNDQPAGDVEWATTKVPLPRLRPSQG